MRITNSMISNRFLSNLNNNMGLMDKYFYQLSTNKRMTKLSDDPSGIVKSMQARVRLNRINQYQDNVSTAHNWLKQTESSMMELNKITVSAYEYAVQITSDYNNPANRQAVGKTIAQYRDHVLDLGNSKLGDRYIFGGYNTTTQPFSLDANGKIMFNGYQMDPPDPALANEAGQIIQLEIGWDMYTDMTIHGTKMMGTGDDNIYNILNDFYNVLMDPDSTAADISPFITKLQDAQNRTLAQVSDLGGRATRLELMADRYDEDFLTYTSMKSQVEDADEAEVIMYYKMAQSVYTASLQAGAQIIQTNLLSFLR